MSGIIKITDTTINVREIMDEISEKVSKVTMEEIEADLKMLNNLNLNINTKGQAEGEISPYILTHIRKPQSKHKGPHTRISNLIIKKIYYVALNSLGEALAQQQQINKALISKLSRLEKKIDQLESSKSKKR